jgi:hypothetical protein
MSRRTRCADPKRTIMSIALAVSMASQPTLAAAGTLAVSEGPGEGPAVAADAAPEGDATPETSPAEANAGEATDGQTPVDGGGEAAGTGTEVDLVVEPEPDTVVVDAAPTSLVFHDDAADTVGQPLAAATRALTKEDMPAPVLLVSFAEGFDTDHVEVDRDSMTATLKLSVTNATVAADGTRLWAGLFIDGVGSPYFMPGASRTVSWPVKVTSIDPVTGEASWELSYRGYSSTDDVAGSLSPAAITSAAVGTFRTEVEKAAPWTVTFDPEVEFPEGTSEGDPFELWFDLANVTDGDVSGPLTISGEGVEDYTLPFDTMGVGGTVFGAVRGTITADAASSRAMDLELTVSCGGHVETVPVTVELPPLAPEWSFEADPLVEVVDARVGGASEVWFSVMNTGPVEVPGPLTVTGEGVEDYALPVGSIGIGGYLSGAFVWHLTEEVLLTGAADVPVTVSFGGVEKDVNVPVEVPQRAREAAREGLCPQASCALAGDAALLPADTEPGSVVTVPMAFTNTTDNPGTLSVAGAEAVALGAGQTVTVDVPVLVTSVADDGTVSFAVPYELCRDGDADGTFTVRGTVADGDVDPLVTADGSLSADVAIEEGFEAPASVEAGDTLSYGIRVTNRGSRDLISVSVNGIPVDLEAAVAPGAYVVVPVTHTVTGDEAASGKVPWTDTVTVASNGGSTDVARPFELSADPVVEPGDDPADDPAEEPSDDPVDDPTDDPVDEPSDGTVPEPAGDPVDKTTDVPVDAPAAQEAPGPNVAPDRSHTAADGTASVPVLGAPAEPSAAVACASLSGLVGTWLAAMRRRMRP